MKPEEIKKLTQEIIHKHKWWDMLSRFIDVLRINLFIIDIQGLVLLPPEEAKHGGRLLTDTGLGFDINQDSIDFEKKFQQDGEYYEASHRYGLHSFAIPVRVRDDFVIAYVVVGPVILNKRLKDSQYQAEAKENGINESELLGIMNEVRVVSQVMMISILNLLSEIIRDNIELSLHNKRVAEEKINGKSLPGKLDKVAEEIYSSVRLDELLVTLLDVAIKMTETEGGSIMVVDDKQKDLTIKVSRGLDAKAIRNARVKIGEGIAGLAAKEKSSFVLDGQKSENNRVQKLLKRPKIKHALVMPLMDKKKVFGVLNLHTMKEENKIQENLDNLQYLSRLLSSAF